MTNDKLWDDISAFELNANVPRTFTSRLAEENNWNYDYALLVTNEYKKFMYLACIMEVTPSLSVDEAWHLHLQYTRNYWKEFCGKILKKEIHHSPGDGTESDDAKYRNVYQETLVAYKKEFGMRPPASVWGGNEESERDEKKIESIVRSRSKFKRILNILTGSTMAIFTLMTLGTGIAMLLALLGGGIILAIVVVRALGRTERQERKRQQANKTDYSRYTRSSSGYTSPTSTKRRKDSDSDNTPGFISSCSSMSSCSTSSSSCSSSSSSSCSSSSCSSGGDSGGGGSSCGSSSCGSSCGGGGCGGGGD